ncbi:MAG: ribonuclease HII [Acetobacteraceae bacterium]|nr:ribonuclease HII [Acetobacteraceae bacterium]
MPDFSLESAHVGLVAGVDEAGRGPLAGPVLAAAVIFTRRDLPAALARLDDSKKLDAATRRALFEALRACEAALVGVGAASSTEIARLNILGATHLAMRRALAHLPVAPSAVLVDGNRAPFLPCKVQCVVGGDAKSLSIAAASIVAKVLRDRVMRALDPRWPAYGFAANAGYPTPAHRAALAARGPCPHHRAGFAPVDAARRSRGSARRAGD